MAALTLSAGAQQLQTFEVASIHPAVNETRGPSFDIFEGGLLRVTSVTVDQLIKSAWLIQESQVAGHPGWLDTDRYDIEAKSAHPGRIGREELKSLLQNLLVDRFALKFHWETRDEPVYALMADKSGAKLTENRDAAFTTLHSSRGAGSVRVIGTRVSMTQLAGAISSELGRFVVDKTDLSGNYDISLEWDPESGPNSVSPSLYSALREKLGLRLESQRSPVQVLVVDSVQKPSDN